MMRQDFKALAEIIEGHELQFQAGYASGLRMFERIIKSQDIFKKLVRLAKNEDGAAQILARIVDLVSRNSDQRYEHPYDTALGVYLLALGEARSECVEDAAEIVLFAKCLWWSAKIARSVLDTPGKQQSDTKSYHETEPFLVSPAARDSYLGSILMMTDFKVLVAELPKIPSGICDRFAKSITSPPREESRLVRSHSGIGIVISPHSTNDILVERHQ